MDSLCGRDEPACEVRVLTAALHALHFYCASLATILIFCCAPAQPPWSRGGGGRCWRWQSVRGASCLAAGVSWSAAAAGSTLRGAERAALAASALAVPAWLAAAALHAALWSRRAAAPLLYLALYWLLAALSSAALLGRALLTDPDPTHLHIYTHAASFIFSLTVAVVDALCFYYEITKRFNNHIKTSTCSHENIAYKHNDVYFFSKITFFWINRLLYKGYKTPLEQEDLGELPDDEVSSKHYNKFKAIYAEKVKSGGKSVGPRLWRCYVSMVWPNYFIAGMLKLLSDLVGLLPPLGLAVILQYIHDQPPPLVLNKPVTVHEFLSNGYVMLFIVTFALIAQALLSQNSTHLVTVEGCRLKTALQAIIFDKCMKLAAWTQTDADVEEDSPLLHQEAGQTQAGVLTNLMSQDTYNIMSCVWICHYMWAIPLKISLILYLLYTKLGISAIIGTATSIILITPFQLFLGKKISDNSKGISKCTDHRMSKMAEILHGINVIKLYVWEDLFKEKILNLREVELKLLNKDTLYWNLLTFSTQASSILVTVVSFTAYYLLSGSEELAPMNVFAGLALFNQLTVPLLILPVTVLMFVQAMVSTQRIEEFLALPESNNNAEEDEVTAPANDKFNEAFIEKIPKDDHKHHAEVVGDGDEVIDDETTPGCEHIVQFRNAVFTWGDKNDSTTLEVDNLDIPLGKLIMVVGPTGSGKSSFLSAIVGEMNLDKGEMKWIGERSAWFSGQVPWLVEGSVRDNVLLGAPFCPQRYARLIRATGLKPDLQLLPEGDSTVLGRAGAPLSGGQRVRVCVARALYARRRLVALDEPLAALDAGLARHVLTRALAPTLPASTVVVATNRRDLVQYADMVIVMEGGRVVASGPPSVALSTESRWARLSSRPPAAPPGGTQRERARLVRVLSRTGSQGPALDYSMMDIKEVRGAYLLPEMATYARGSWRRPARRPAAAAPPPVATLSRQFSSPPAEYKHAKAQRQLRRAVSWDVRLRRDASFVRRLLPARRPPLPPPPPPPPPSTQANTDVENPQQNGYGKVDDSNAEATFASLTSNGVTIGTASESDGSSGDSDAATQYENGESETAWRVYMRACGAWSWACAACAGVAHALAVAADAGLARAAYHSHTPVWAAALTFALLSGGGAAAWALAGWCGGAAGARARRRLHAALLDTALHAPAPSPARPPAALLHSFGADMNLIDKKLPTALWRWLQVALVCGGALLVNVCAAPWSLVALLPSLALYFLLQNVYLTNSRELQRLEGAAAGPAAALAGCARAGAGCVRVSRLQRRLRARLLRRLDADLAALLLLNATSRWLGLAMDLVGAVAVFVALGLAILDGGSAGLAGLAGAQALLLPTYLAHLAKCRADLDAHLAAVDRVHADINVPHEDYREDCPIPSDWPRDGKIVFENVTIQHEPGAPPILSNVNFTIQPGEKVVVCGRSGAGKSSLVAAAVGAVGAAGAGVVGGAAPGAGGRVLVGGAECGRVPLRALRRRLVVLPQDAAAELFAGSLRDNLDPLKVHTDAQLWRALTTVQLHDFVAAQPAGLECCVSVCGAGGWSGGRRARLAAARALVAARGGGAAALLLDEPGAALPAAAARALSRALAQACPHLTILTVAHRMSCISEYPRALLVAGGTVTELLPVRRAAAAAPSPQNPQPTIDQSNTTC